MKLFDFALELILKHEGGYVNHSRDPGGETVYGISRRAHPDAWANGRPTIEQAAAIYRRDYWDACKCEQLPAPLAVFLFDTAVNCGNRAAVRMLQRAVGVNADGLIGPNTLAKCAQVDAQKAVLHFADVRMEHYKALPTFNTFGKGWTRRVNDLVDQVEVLEGAA